MKPVETFALKYNGTDLQILNQNRLPHQEQWRPITSAEDLKRARKSLSLRGSGLLALSAILWMALSAEKGATVQQLRKIADEYLAYQSTSIYIQNHINRLVQYLDENYTKERFVGVVEEMIDEDIYACTKISEMGSSLFYENENILTHSNAGSLSIAGEGTAIGVIKKVFEQGKNPHVYVAETRPMLEGARLTTYELEKANIPYTLICDSLAPTLMREGKIQRVIVGADRIAANGDVAAKMGTYTLAIACDYHTVPFYIAAPHSAVDKQWLTGEQIPMEERGEAEVLGVQTSFGEIVWAPTKARAYNPGFDVTPAKLVTSWIMDDKVYDFFEA